MGRVFAILLVLIASTELTNLVSTSIIRNPVDTEVMVGQSTYLNCSTSDPSREIYWYHHPVGTETKDHHYVYAHGRMHPPYDNRFRIEKLSSPGSFDLVIANVEFQDAGLYVCQNGGGTGQLISAQLIVLDSAILCETNIKPEGFIGPNNCKLHVPIDKVQLSCAVNYHGNIPPALDWTMDGQIIRQAGSMPSCSHSDTRITCTEALDATINMDGFRFICQTTRAAKDQYRCTTDRTKVLYALSDKKPVEKYIGDDVSCPAIESSASCSYIWVWFDGVTEKIVSNDHSLKVEEQGWHKCQANCKLKENPCAVVPMLVKASSVPAVPAASNDSKIDVIIAVVVTFALCAMIAAIPGYFIWRKVTGETRELKASVETLREKDSMWKEENAKIQEQLEQVEALTATMMETQTKQQNQPTENEMERNLEQMTTVIRKLLRPRPGLSYHEEATVITDNFRGNLVLASKDTKKERKENPSGQGKNDKEETLPFIYTFFDIDNYNVDISNDRKRAVLCKTEETSKSNDNMVFNKPTGRIGQ